MLGYKKRYFNSFITKVENNIAYVTAIDNIDFEKSYMDIPIKDLKNRDIECKAGIIFSMTLKKWLLWEKIIFTPSMKRKPLSKEEINKAMSLYDKYKDL